MNHAAVVAGLMSGYLGFFFENQQAAVRISLQQFSSDRQPDDSGADNSNVKGFR